MKQRDGGFTVCAGGEEDIGFVIHYLQTDSCRVTEKTSRCPRKPNMRAAIAAKVAVSRVTWSRPSNALFDILEKIDEIVADGLGLTPADHDTIRKRCQELPLSVTVERPRFVWSAEPAKLKPAAPTAPANASKRKHDSTRLPGRRYGPGWIE